MNKMISAALQERLNNRLLEEVRDVVMALHYSNGTTDSVARTLTGAPPPYTLYNPPHYGRVKGMLENAGREGYVKNCGPGGWAGSRWKLTEKGVKLLHSVYEYLLQESLNGGK